MDFYVTRQSVLNIADKLNELHGVPRRNTMDLISELLGKKDWLELSSLLVDSTRESDIPSKPLTVFGITDSPVKVLNPLPMYLEAFGSNSATFGNVLVDNQFMEILHDLHNQVLVNKLESAAKVLNFDFDVDAELNLSGHRLVVDDTQFWLEAYPKHSSDHIYTCTVNIADFIEAQTKLTSIETLQWIDDVLFAASSQAARDFAEYLAEDHINIDLGNT